MYVNMMLLHLILELTTTMMVIMIQSGIVFALKKDVEDILCGKHESRAA